MSTSSYNSQAASHREEEDHKNDVVDMLKALDRKEQLIMFLTGSAGAGKTAAVKLAQKVYFEFCKEVGIRWNDRTFIFHCVHGVGCIVLWRCDYM